MKYFLQLLIIFSVILTADKSFSEELDLARLQKGALILAKNNPAGEDKVNYEIFLKWMEEKGNDLTGKWLEGEKISPEYEKYLPIIRYNVIRSGARKRNNLRETALKQVMFVAPMPGDAIAEFAGQVYLDGAKTMLKGYRGEKLDEKDSLKLWNYLMFASQVRFAQILPYSFGYSRSAPLKPGEKAPDFRLPRLKTVLDEPCYSDTEIKDPAAIFRPDSIKRLTGLFQGYEAKKDKDGKEIIVEKQVQTGLGQKEEDYLSLSAFRVKKPVVVIVAQPDDAFMKRCLPATEFIFNAYRDKVEFVLIGIRSWDNTTGAYFAPDPKKTDEWLPIPLDVARRAKETYLAFPNVTIPCLVDDMCLTTRNKYMVSAATGEYFVIIDADGKLAYALEPEKSYGPYEEDRWANDLERNLRVLLKIEPGKTSLDEGEERTEGIQLASQEKSEPSMWLYGKVKSVDPESGKITVVRQMQTASSMQGYAIHRTSDQKGKSSGTALSTLDKWIREGGKDCVFRIEDNTVLIRNAAPAKFADLKVGDAVGIKFDLADDGKPEILAAQIRASTLGN